MKRSASTDDGAGVSAFARRTKPYQGEESTTPDEVLEDQDLATTTTKNPPILVDVYKDPTRQQEWVSIMVSLPEVPKRGLLFI